MISGVTSSSLLLSAASLLSLLANLASAQENGVPTTCYVIDGDANSNAGFRCNNHTTGHSPCCGIGGICYSNGVCQQSNGGVQDYLRVGCTDPTWQDPACLDQCAVYAPDSSAGIRFCDGSITSTTQYCCDNGTSGIGSFECCKTPTDIFEISPAATFLAQIPLTYTSTSSSTSSTSSSSSSTSAPSTTASTSTLPTSSLPVSVGDSGSSSHGVAIGVGVGVPLGLIALACVGLYFYSRRRKAKNAAFAAATDGGVTVPYSDNQHEPHQAGAAARGAIPMVPDPKKGYFAGRDYSAPPQELASNEVHEMPAAGRK